MGIDLNAVEEDGEAVTSRELWHACAGAGVTLPRRGSRVVYLPQAHLAAGGGGEEAPPLGAGAVPVQPHVACRVVGVELCVSLPGWPASPRSFCFFCSRYGLKNRSFADAQADVPTDEVYARLALVAEGEVSAAATISFAAICSPCDCSISWL
jgi:auxin response factor